MPDAPQQQQHVEPAQPFNNTDVQTIERGEERCVGNGNGFDRGRGVGNGLDRGRRDVVVDGVDMPARDVLAFQVLLLLKATPRWNAISGIQQYSSSGMRTSK